MVYRVKVKYNRTGVPVQDLELVTLPNTFNSWEEAEMYIEYLRDIIMYQIVETES